MGKISDYTRVLVSKLTDVLACDQTDNGTTETKSATVEQIGTAIGTLQNFADLDTSNKNLVDAINEIASYTPVYGNTASGSIATFDTSLALPLQDCTIEINAVQESGTPTPSSPKAISGFTGANIHVADDETPHVIDNVTPITWQSEAGTVYGGSLDITSGVLTVTWVGIAIDSVTWYYSSGNAFFYCPNATLPNSRKVKGGIICECYAVYPTAIASTSQIPLLPDKQIYYNASNGNINIKDTDYTDETTFINNVGSHILAFEIETPVTYQLTPTQISAIVGTNNVFTDTNGNTSVVYACSLKDYIEGQ